MLSFVARSRGGRWIGSAGSVICFAGASLAGAPTIKCLAAVLLVSVIVINLVSVFLVKRLRAARLVIA